MFCSKCGKEIADEAVVCVYCGCMVKNTTAKATSPAPAKTTTEKSPKVSLILGIVGIKEYKETGKMTGLVLSLIGEVCSIFSSIIGAVAMSGMF